MKKQYFGIAWLVLLAITLCACQKQAGSESGTATGTATPTAQPADATKTQAGLPGSSQPVQGGGALGGGWLGFGAKEGETMPLPAAGTSVATGSYADVVNLFDRMAGMMDRFASAIEIASTPGEAARAMNTLADTMEKMEPEIKRLMAAHPELEKMKEPPAEIRDAFVRVMKATQRMQSAAINEKMQKFATDKAVQDAAMRMMKAGQSFQTINK